MSVIKSRFGIDNHVIRKTSTITALSESATYPGTNLRKHKVRPPYRTDDQHIDLDGSTQWLSITGASNKFDFDAAFTIEMVLTPDAVSATKHLIDKWNTTAARSYKLEILSTGAIKLYLSTDGAAEVSITTDILLYAERSYRLKAIYIGDIQEVVLYLDCVELCRANNTTQLGCTLSGTIPTSLFQTNSANLYVGRAQAGGGVFDGQIALVGLSPIAFDHGGWLKPANCDPTGIKGGYYDMTNYNAVGPVEEDISGSGYDLTVVGSPAYGACSAWQRIDVDYGINDLVDVKTDTVFSDRRHSLSSAAQVRAIFSDPACNFNTAGTSRGAIAEASQTGLNATSFMIIETSIRRINHLPASTYNYLCRKWATTKEQYIFRVVSATGVVEFIVNDGVGTSVWSSASGIIDFYKEYRVAIVFDQLSESAQLWVNGSLVAWNSEPVSFPGAIQVPGTPDIFYLGFVDSSLAGQISYVALATRRQTYDGTPIKKEGCVSYWIMTGLDGSGNIADSVGSNDLTPTNIVEHNYDVMPVYRQPVEWTDKALDFTGSEYGMRGFDELIMEADEFDSGVSIEVDVDIRTLITPSGTATIISLEDIAGSEDCFRIWQNDNEIYFQVNNGASKEFALYELPAIGRRTFKFVFDHSSGFGGTHFYIYEDSVQVKTDTGATAGLHTPVSSAGVGLGALHDGSDAGNNTCKLHKVAVLTEVDNNGESLQEDQCWAYYRLDGDLQDSSGTGNHLIPVNFVSKTFTATDATDKECAIEMLTTAKYNRQLVMEINDSTSPLGYISIAYLGAFARSEMERGFIINNPWGRLSLGRFSPDSAGGFTSYLNATDLWASNLTWKPRADDLAILEEMIAYTVRSRPVMFFEGGEKDTVQTKTRLVYNLNAIGPQQFVARVNNISIATTLLQEAGGGD